MEGNDYYLEGVISGGGALPEYVARSYGAYTNQNKVTLTLPTGTTTGDTVIVDLWQNSATITPPAGWTTVKKQNVWGTSSTTYYRKLDGTETDYDFDFDDYYNACWVAWSFRNLGDLDTSIYVANEDGDDKLESPGLTTAEDGEYLIMIGYTQGNFTTTAYDSPLEEKDEWYESGRDISRLLGAGTLASMGTTGALNATLSSSGSSSDCTLLLAFRAGTMSAPAAIEWENLVGCTADGNTLTKTAATGWGNGTATSVQTIPDGGYAEFLRGPVPGSTQVMVGLSYTGTSFSDYQDIEYCVHMYQYSPYTAIYESGTYKNTFIHYMVENERLRIYSNGTVVTYRYYDGADHLEYTSLSSPTHPLRVCVDMYDNGVTVTGWIYSG